MTTRVEVDEIETTTGEKVLAVVLAVFISVGAIWAYVRIDDIGDEPGPIATMASPAEREAIRTHQAATNALFAAQEDARRARREVTFSREAYRTALDAGEAAAGLQQTYLSAQRDLETAEARVAEARERVAATQPAANEARARANAERREELEGGDRRTFLLRLLLFAGMLGSSYYAMGRFRRSRSRYMPAVYAWIGASAVLAVVMAGDYIGNYVEFSETGPLAISVAGIVLTLAAFTALQRYLARRIPGRRVRKGDCPFCGFPVRGEHCEGCGRAVIAACARCERPRRVGTEHCAACGHA